jgi:F-type H+-transporting ATPase subunit gamma
MAKTQDLKRRIRSVKNTMQLTKAMRMVAAAKLRRAQERMMKSRPYTYGLQRVLRSLAARANPEEHPLLQIHGDKKVEIVVITADKGLCGAFNSGIVRTAERFARGQRNKQLSWYTVGKKGRDYFARRMQVDRQEIDIFRDVQYVDAKRIADDLIERYINEELDQIHLVFNEFKSAIQAKPIVMQLLPIEPEEIGAGEIADEYIYEPSAEKLFNELLPGYVRMQVYHALLESMAAEHAARMTAMESATNNAGELIESLTLTMNRVRQASITTEIIEVVSGAEALH